MSDPLDQFFGLNNSGELKFDKDTETEMDMDVTGDSPAMDSGESASTDGELFDFQIEIPENAQLSDVTKLALEAYKQQIDVLKFIEPKYRNRGFEVAQQYLTIAQNAIRQDLELQQKQQKLDLDKKKAFPNEEEPEEELSKDNLYKLVKGGKT